MRSIISFPAILFLHAVLAILTASCGESVTEKGRKTMEISVKCPVFKDGEMIPSRYTCDGVNVSPPITWSDPPESTKSLALICDDPDAPMGTWVHWVVYNIAPNQAGFGENVPTGSRTPDGAVQGVTDFGTEGYGGPCPPSGTHRYYFKVYALDMELSINGQATKKQVVDAMKGHILAQGQIMGRYKRQR